MIPVTLETTTARSMNRRLGFAAVVTAVIGMGLVPAWNIHIVPESVRRLFHFRYNIFYKNEYEALESHLNWIRRRKGIALALKKHLKPGDSIVDGGIGELGYYSGLKIYDTMGLVNRSVATRPAPTQLGSPGHDKRVDIRHFLPELPTVLFFAMFNSPTPSSQNPPSPLSRRIRTIAEEWREGYPLVWRRYVPEILPLKSSPDGSPRVLLIYRLIEGEPEYVKTLPRQERVAYRKKRARRAWAEFYGEVDTIAATE